MYLFAEDIKESFAKNLYKLFDILNCKYSIIHCYDFGCLETVESPPTVIILWSIPLPCMNVILLSAVISACFFGFIYRLRGEAEHVSHLQFRISKNLPSFFMKFICLLAFLCQKINPLPGSGTH